jgi:hypothetical protein
VADCAETAVDENAKSGFLMNLAPGGFLLGLAMRFGERAGARSLQDDEAK